MYHKYFMLIVLRAYGAIISCIIMLHRRKYDCFVVNLQNVFIVGKLLLKNAFFGYFNKLVKFAECIPTFSLLPLKFAK